MKGPVREGWLSWMKLMILEREFVEVKTQHSASQFIFNGREWRKTGSYLAMAYTHAACPQRSTQCTNAGSGTCFRKS